MLRGANDEIRLQVVQCLRNIASWSDLAHDVYSSGAVQMLMDLCTGDERPLTCAAVQALRCCASHSMLYQRPQH